MVEYPEDWQIPIELEDIRIMDKGVIVPISKVNGSVACRVIDPRLIEDIFFKRNSFADSSIKVVNCQSLVIKGKEPVLFIDFLI